MCNFPVHGIFPNIGLSHYFGWILYWVDGQILLMHQSLLHTSHQKCYHELLPHVTTDSQLTVLSCRTRSHTRTYCRIRNIRTQLLSSTTPRKNRLNLITLSKRTWAVREVFFFLQWTIMFAKVKKFSLSFKVCLHAPTLCPSPSQCPSKFSIMSVGTASKLDKSVWNPFCLSLIDTMVNFDRHCNTDGPILGTCNGWFTSRTRTRIQTRIRRSFPVATVVLCRNFTLHGFRFRFQS